MSIHENLENLIKKFDDDQFLLNRGLGNEIGLYVFPYDPKDELTIRRFLNRLVRENDKQRFNVHLNDLYEIFLDICRENDLIDDLVDYEANHGFESLLEQVAKFAPVEEYIKKIEPKQRTKGKDIVIISGVGRVYPYMRAHLILENIQPIITDVPVVVFYPGQYDYNSLNLFNLIKDGNYYRAFNLLEG